MAIRTYLQRVGNSYEFIRIGELKNIRFSKKSFDKSYIFYEFPKYESSYEFVRMTNDVTYVHIFFTCVYYN